LRRILLRLVHGKQDGHREFVHVGSQLVSRHVANVGQQSLDVAAQTAVRETCLEQAQLQKRQGRQGENARRLDQTGDEGEAEVFHLRHVVLIGQFEISAGKIYQSILK